MITAISRMCFVLHAIIKISAGEFFNALIIVQFFFLNFCGIVNCFDGSDEFTNQPGLKCNESVLPQNNLHDAVAH